MKTLGERVKYARELRGWSQNALDKQAKLSQGQTSRLERNERGASSATLLKLANTLRVRAEWLLTGTPPMELETAEHDAVPNRAMAARLAREDGVYELAIASVCLEPGDANALTRSVLWWADRMRLRQREMIDGAREVANAATPAPASIVRHGTR